MEGANRVYFLRSDSSAARARIPRLAGAPARAFATSARPQCAEAMGLISIIKKVKAKEKEMRLLMVGLDNAGKARSGVGASSRQYTHWRLRKMLIPACSATCRPPSSSASTGRTFQPSPPRWASALRYLHDVCLVVGTVRCSRPSQCRVPLARATSQVWMLRRPCNTRRTGSTSGTWGGRRPCGHTGATTTSRRTGSCGWWTAPTPAGLPTALPS